MMFLVYSVIAFFMVALNTIIYWNNLSQSTDSKFYFMELSLENLLQGLVSFLL